MRFQVGKLVCELALDESGGVETFRDAKAMARPLRDALKAQAIETTHTEALELIAKAFGCKSGTFCPLRSKLPNRSQSMSARFRPVATNQKNFDGDAEDIRAFSKDA
jgi:hypothetical protein